MIVPSSRPGFSPGRNRSVRQALSAAAPSLGACLFAVWCGTFYSGASATATIVSHALLLGVGVTGFVLGAGAAGRRKALDPPDPLGLGRGGAFLLAGLLAAVALAWWLSPVPRAGRVGMLLLAPCLGLPAAVAAAWPTQRARRAGLGWVAAGVAAVSLWALGRWIVSGAALPAEPLGQHLLLATWIVTLLPLAALAARAAADAPSRRRAWGWLALGGVAAALGALTVLATRSFAGALALALEAFVLLALLPRARPASGAVRGLLAAVAGLATAVVVALGVVAARGGDPSLAARLVYWRAGWQGLLDRPLVGYGPGSTAWTLAGALRPVPGVSPPQEVVGEIHLLPLAVAYELGLPALALASALALTFWRRRVREMAAGDDPALTAAGLAGLAGVAVMGLATADWRLTALPVAAAVTAGAALAGARRPGPASVEGGGTGRSGRRVVWSLAAAYALVAGVLLAPVDRAHRLYDRAYDRAAELAAGGPRDQGAGPAELLRRAVLLDPGFPLYRFHAARQDWLAPGGRREVGAVAREAVRAAELGRGVAALWLRGGAAAALAGSPEIAAPAFELACALDPLGAMAPFSLLAVGSPLHRLEAVGARALAAEPRLGAATLWEERPELLEAVLAELAGVDGIDAGWREEAVRRIRSLPRGAGAGRVATVALVVDGRPAASLSLHAFRRLPWRVDLVPVPVRAAAIERLSGLPPATVLAGTDPRLFPATCTGPFAPQTLRKTLWKTW